MAYGVSAALFAVSRAYRESQIKHELLVLAGLLAFLGGGTAIFLLIGRVGHRLPRQIELWAVVGALMLGGVGYVLVGVIAVMVALALTAIVLAAALFA